MFSNNFSTDLFNVVDKLLHKFKKYALQRKAASLPETVHTGHFTVLVFSLLLKGQLGFF